MMRWREKKKKDMSEFDVPDMDTTKSNPNVMYDSKPRRGRKR
jgi:hypothetical protein